MTSLWDAIAEQIAAATGEPFNVQKNQTVGGGCINAAHRVGDGERDYFVKLNDDNLLDMFEAEAEALQAMADTETVRVPRPVCWGTAAGQSFLVMENLELGGRGGLETFGRQLAAMHGATWDRFAGSKTGLPQGAHRRYGWHRDNTIGSTPQPNTPDDDWVRFWRERRLGFQLELAARKGHGGALQKKGEALMDRLDGLFDGYTPEPSLLHGDLWGGNYAVTRSGEPVIFDPATYYGDREADLAMTELFGGFGGAFFSAYHEAWPVDPGYSTRKTLYNLYHMLNHLNLFGGGYGFSSERMMDELLSELR